MKIVERQSIRNKSNIAVKTKRKDEHFRFESFVLFPICGSGSKG